MATLNNSNKISSSALFSNPVSVNQLVDLDVDLQCLPTIDLTCGGLNPLLQALIDKVCGTPNFDLGCLTASQTYDSVIQALVDQVCVLTEAYIEPSTPLDLSTVNLALSSTWACGELNPIVPTGATNEEIIQALVSRVIDLSVQVQTNCDLIADLENRLTQAEADIAAINCCP